MYLIRDLLSQTDGHVAQHALSRGIWNVLQGALKHQRLVMSGLVYLQKARERLLCKVIVRKKKAQKPLGGQGGKTNLLFGKNSITNLGPD